VVVDDGGSLGLRGGPGLRRGSVLARAPGATRWTRWAEGSPAGLRRPGRNSPFARPSGETGYADMTIHETAGGVLVFANRLDVLELGASTATKRPGVAR